MLLLVAFLVPGIRWGSLFFSSGFRLLLRLTTRNVLLLVGGRPLFVLPYGSIARLGCTSGVSRPDFSLLRVVGRCLVRSGTISCL
ncbi:hypothetical protein F4810DRAFT_235634 [Camillea tinctor]|nr:hypothetical protein F4810DRAFT_235634 [Camillea tinctor]